jgi:DNA-binding NarL/FixJ family response regulator
VCMLTGDNDAGTMMRALLAGADDYLLKLHFDAVRDVEAMIARSAIPKERAALDPDHHWRFLRSADLSEEQVEAVWTYAALGFPETKELAAQLEISEQAASKLMRRAEEKLGVANKGQLVRLLTVLSGFGLRQRLRGS